MKFRQNLYLDRSVADALDALAARPGANKSRIVNDALAAYLANRAASQIDEQLRLRLDRLSREHEAIRRDLEVLLESLSLFIQHQLTVGAPLPDNDPAAVAIGRDRFEKFINRVGRQIAAGRSTLAPQAAEGGR